MTVRLYPEARTALINWIEENFHDIDEFVFTASLKDGTTMTVYDCYTAVSAIGLAEMMKLSCHQAMVDETFTPKKRDN